MRPSPRSSKDDSGAIRRRSDSAADRDDIAAIEMSFATVSRELIAAVQRVGLPTSGTYVERARRLRDSNLVDIVFANRLERLSRAAMYAETRVACGQPVIKRNVNEFVHLAADLIEKLRSVQAAA